MNELIITIAGDGSEYAVQLIRDGTEGEVHILSALVDNQVWSNW